MRRILLTIASCVALAAIAPAAVAQQMSDEDLLKAYSDDGLSLLELHPEAVASADCDINSSERQDCDDLLLLTTNERDASIATHAPWSLPQASGTTANERLVVNREYVINHDADLHEPLWAAYRLREDDIVARSRRKCFRQDPRLSDTESAALVDYVEPKFDRGHLVPRADMNRSKPIMINTFLLSNMTPQTSKFNSGIWENLESMVRVWAVRKGTIYVTTGAIFDSDNNEARDDDGNVPRVTSTNRVGIPTHFYKIVMHELPNGFIESIAIVLPHEEDDDHGDEFSEVRDHIKSHITSIDQIEKLTSTDMFSGLDDVKETAVESFVATDLWPLQGN